MNWILLACLMFLSLEDIVKKALPLWQLFLGSAGAAVFVVMNCISGYMNWRSVVFSILPAAVFLLLSRISKEQIGYGDGLLLLPLGLILGFEKICMLLVWALCLGAVCALAIVVCSRQRGMELPFVPFLLAGYVLIGGAG